MTERFSSEYQRLLIRPIKKDADNQTLLIQPIKKEADDQTSQSEQAELPSVTESVEYFVNVGWGEPLNYFKHQYSLNPCYGNFSWLCSTFFLFFFSRSTLWRSQKQRWSPSTKGWISTQRIHSANSTALQFYFLWTSTRYGFCEQVHFFQYCSFVTFMLYSLRSVKGVLAMMTEKTRKTSLKNKNLRNCDYFAIIPCCSHFYNVNEEPCNWISLSAVKVNTQH